MPSNAVMYLHARARWMTCSRNIRLQFLRLWPPVFWIGVLLLSGSLALSGVAIFLWLLGRP